MKTLLLALLLPIGAYAQKGVERRIPLSVLPTIKDSVGGDSPCARLCRQMDTLKRRMRLIEVQHQASYKALCEYNPTGNSVSLRELCVLITAAQRNAVKELKNP